MRFFRRSLTGLYMLAVTVALLALAANTLRSALETRLSRDDAAQTASERVFAVPVVTVTPTSISPVLQAFGEVRAQRALEVRVQAGGPIVELGDDFEEGGRVEAGQLLLRVDPVDLEDALAIARTDMDEAEAEVWDADNGLDIARDDLKNARDQSALVARALARQQDLADRGIGSDAQIEAAALAVASADQAVLSRRAALAAAEARIAQAETRLERSHIALNEAERRLAETEVRAAFSGRLSNVNGIEGRIVTPNEQVATLIDLDALEVSFRLSTAQYARLVDEEGQLIGARVAARLAVSGVDLVAEGRIERESAEVGEGQTGRLLFARLDAAPGLRPGDFVTVEIEEPQLSGVARLPAAAIGTAGTVLALGEGDRLEEVAVEVLRRQGDSVLVNAEPLAGRDVVTKRTPVVGAGIRVRPLRSGGEQDDRIDDEENADARPEMIPLDNSRRTRLIQTVEGNSDMPADAKQRVLHQLAQPEVPAHTVARIESRMGG